MKYVTKCGVAALWWLALLSAPQAWALQSVSGHDAAVVKVSNRDLNRIALPSKVLKAYTSKPIDVKVEGRDVYVKVPATTAGPIELYLLTEEDTYTLMLVPVPTPAETVVIKAGSDTGPSLEGEPYVRQIKSLLRAIASGAVPKGYDESPVTDAKEECTLAQCSLIPTRRYLGARLSVTEYRLANPDGEPRAYSEASFDQPGTRAVAIERQPIEPGGATRLFRVEEVAP
ncbi:MAG: type-F conjugative transfer system secretin TraK [Nitrospirota bacterium]